MTTVPQTYQLVDVAELQAHPENPRRGHRPALRESIDANGFYGAVIVQASSGTILAGRHRWEEAKEAGVDQLPAILVDVDDSTARRIVLADNRTSDLAGYDDSVLLQLLEAVSLDEAGLLGTGFSYDDLADLQLERIGDQDDDDDDGEVKTASEDVMSRLTADAQRKDGNRRLLVLDLPVAQFVWLVEGLAQVCEDLGVETNTAAVLRLVGDHTGRGLPDDD